MRMISVVFVLSNFLVVHGIRLHVGMSPDDIRVNEETIMDGEYPEEVLVNADGDADGNSEEGPPRMHPWGNYMAQVANDLYRADQCGKCGGPTVQVSGGDKRAVSKKLMNAPFSVTMKGDHCSATCDADAGRHVGDNGHNTETKNMGDVFPHYHVVKNLFNTHLYPHTQDQAGLAQLREDLKDTLVVHLRAGDVMAGNTRVGGSDYNPAPCKYVTSEIERSGLKKALLVTSDSSHPCISYIKDKTNVEVQHKAQTEAEDVRFMMSATNIVLSTSSTFGLAAMMMFPGKHEFIAMPTYMGKHCCDTSFFESRLNEMCEISQKANIYEIPAPVKEQITKDFIQEDANFVGTVVHKCK